MRGLTRTIAPMALVLMAAASASAAPVFLRCHGTREVANIVEGAHVSFQDVEFLKIDAENNLIAESEKRGELWRNLCDRGGADCRFGEKSFSVTASGSGLKLSLSVDRFTRTFKRETDEGNLLSQTDSWCDAMPDPGLPAPRQF